MNILMITNIDSDEKLEDIWLARAFQEDGHTVAIVDKNYDEKLESIFDIFLKRNTWSSSATIENVSEKYTFRERIIKKNLPRINFDGKYDGSDKSYLVKLFKNGYEVIPTIDNLDDLKLLDNPNKYMLKLKESYDGIGQLVLKKEELELKFNNSYIIQPFMKFKSEVQFYYIKNRFPKSRCLRVFLHSTCILSTLICLILKHFTALLNLLNFITFTIIFPHILEKSIIK